MIIAEKKKKENIIEYLIYMFQIEDVIRANKFDIKLIGKNVIDKYKQSDNKLNEISEWYEGLLKMMIIEGIQKSGHLNLLNEIINKLYDYHLSLLTEDKNYQKLFSYAISNIQIMRKKSGSELNDIAICLNSIYMFVLMRIQKSEISEETTEAITSFSNFLAYLAQKYNSKC